MSETNKRADEVKQERRRRQNTGPLSGLKLHVPEEAKDPNYVYRWINDDGRRIHAKTVMDDWDIVKDGTVPTEGQGSVTERLAGKTEGGQPLKTILCRKPKRFYEEDKGKEEAAIKASEDAMKRGAPAVAGGLSGPTTYIPDRADGYSRGPGTNQIGTTYKP